MASAPPKKRRKIRGITTVVPRVPIVTWEYGKRKPRTEMWASNTEKSENLTTTPDISTITSIQAALWTNNMEAETAPGDILQEHQDRGTSTPATTSNSESNYAKNRRKRNEKWEVMRKFLVHAIMEEKAPTMNSCAVCGEPAYETIIRCSDCGPMAYFCPECCVKHHQLITLHKPEQWKDGCFEPFELPTMTWKRCDHECGGTYTRNMLLLDHEGLPQWQLLQFCQCEDEPFTLARYGFWPATPLNPMIGVSMRLLTSFRSLVFAGQISLSAFSASLKHRYESQFSMNLDAHRALNWDMVLNFMLVYHQVTSLENIVPGLAPPQDCPACPENTKVIAMDGNFSLVRRRAPGTSVPAQARHPDRYFLEQNDVDDFVKNYKESSSGKKTCSDFQAGSLLRSKNRNEKLEVKGVFGSVCRHDCPYKFLDLKHGERLAYPVYVLNQIKDKTRMVMYDIACQLKTHLQKRNAVPEGITLAVPIFHVYGHNMQCQFPANQRATISAYQHYIRGVDPHSPVVTIATPRQTKPLDHDGQVNFSPRRVQGAGLCDGEGTERLWSYMGEFSNITKEMTAENRRDLLTELLLHYTARLTNQMVSALCHKMNRACLMLQSTESELLKMMSSLPGQLSRADIEGWVQHQRDAVAVELPAELDDWRNSYVLSLEQYYTIREKLIQQDPEQHDGQDDDDLVLARVEQKLKRTERQRKIRRWEKDCEEYTIQLAEACEERRKCRILEVREEAIEYTFHTEKRRTRSDGQAIAKRITKQVVSASKKLDSAIERYNQTPKYGRGEHTFTRAMALDLNSASYSILWDDDVEDHPIPGSIRRKAIDVYELNTRAREEIGLVAQDMVQFKKSVDEREKVLSAWLADQPNLETISQFQLGCAGKVKKALKDLSNVQCQVERHLAPFTKSQVINVTKFVQHLQTIESESPLKSKGRQMLALLEEIALLEEESRAE